MITKRWLRIKSTNLRIEPLSIANTDSYIRKEFVIIINNSYSKNMIVGKNIKKKYGTLDVLKGVDLHISEAEVVSIVGSSGAGKTTLLTILGT